MVKEVKWGITELCYGFFSTLANPTRLMIIDKLSEKPMNSTSIAKQLNQEKSMVSHNLMQLSKCNFVQVRRKGKQRIYSLNMETLEPLMKVVENHAKRFCSGSDACPFIKNLKSSSKV